MTSLTYKIGNMRANTLADAKRCSILTGKPYKAVYTREFEPSYHYNKETKKIEKL